jgi:hypothetical protein
MALQTRASPGLTKDFLGASTIMVKEICDDLDGNLELQAIVKQRIAEYKRARKDAEDAGTNIGQLVQSTIQSRKRKSDDSPDTEERKKQVVIIEIPDTPLRRGQRIFGSWTIKMCKQLFQYVDPNLDMTAIATMKQDTYFECMERAFELKLFGDQKDRVGITDSQRKLFQNLKQVYVGLGSRLSDLVVDTANGTVDWSSCSPLRIASQKKNEVVIEYKASRDAKPLQSIVGEEILRGDAGPFFLGRDYSLANACLKSTLNEYNISGLFGAVAMRKLKPRLSDTTGVVDQTPSAKVSAEEAKQASLDKKSKAKAKPLGKVRLCSGGDVGLAVPASAADPALGPAAGSSSKDGQKDSLNQSKKLKKGQDGDISSEESLPPPPAAVAEAKAK